MHPIPMVRASAIVPFVSFLESAGAPAERLMQQVRLSPRIFESPEQLLPLHQGMAFLERAARAEKLTDIGLQVGLRTRFHELGAFGLLVRGVPTLQQALNRIVDAIALYNSGEVIWLDCEGDRALMCHKMALSDVGGQRHGALFAVVMIIEAIRSVLGPQWVPAEVRLSAAEEPNRRHYETMLDAPVVCGSQFEAVVFPQSLLAKAPVTRIPSIVEESSDHDFLRSTAQAADFAGSVRQAISTLLCDGYPNIQVTAEAVGFSVRTLQRRLSEAGESYHHLMEVCVSRRACGCCETLMPSSSISPGSWGTPTQPILLAPFVAGPELRRVLSGARRERGLPSRDAFKKNIKTKM